MPTLNSVISGFVVGDSKLLTRTVPGINTADVVASAKLTVKASPQELGYIFQKSITTGAVVGQGQITDAGGVGDGDGTAALTFELTPTNTGRMVGDRAYYFDIEVTTAGSAKYTPESGTIIASSQITI